MSIAVVSNGTHRPTPPAPRGGALARAIVAAAVLLAGASPAAACDLDGLSHGYGPMSALFAGAHQYKSLNGLDETADEPAPEAATIDAPAEAAARSAEADADADSGARADATAAVDAGPPPPSTPRRSFVAWAKARPKPAGSAEAPASWAQGDPPRSADPSRADPEPGQPEQGEQRQRPPSGGPVP
jgi:hypothetical protein